MILNEINTNSNSITDNSNSNKFLKRNSGIKWVDNLNKNRKSIIQKNKIDIATEISAENMIAKAEIHRRANRPLIKLKEFDGNTKFCQCCYLPAEDNKYLRICNFCENTDKFADYGRGTSLFFSYYRFSILILAFSLCLMALPSFFLNNYYTNELIETCSKIYIIEGEYISNNFPDCTFFIKNDNWEFKYDSMNLKYYRNIYKKIIGNDYYVDKTLINYHIINFISLVALFIINILYIVLLYNINHQYNLSITSPSDFTIIISNLHSAFKIFWKNIRKINNVIKSGNNISDGNFEEYKKELEILGLQDYPKDKEINIFEGFNHFIKNKICVSSDGDKFNIYRINICYKINEFMEIEEQIQELKKKIYKIDHQKYILKKNQELNLEGDERKYFYNPLQKLGIDLCNSSCCEKYEILSDIKKQKENLENKLKELLSQTENLTEENFSGVVFVTFNNIEESEKFLAPYPKNLIMSIFNLIKNLKYFLCCCCVKKSKREHFFLNRNIQIKVAPEPEDVIFENLQYSSFQRFFRTVLVYFLSLIIIFICFIIILILNDIQIKKMKKNNNNIIIKYGISISITLIISMLNTIFQLILEGLTKKEKQTSNTDYYLSFSIKLTIFTFLTSGIIPLFSSYYHSKSKYDLLLTNMLTLFLSNSFLTPIMWSLNFEFFLKRLKICLIKDNYENYTQDELNKIYELINMNLSYKYSYIFKTLLMSFLYMPIFPMSIAISFLGFLFGYFLEKFNFSKMYKRPEMLNSKICEFYSNYFIINFFMLCLGDYIFIRDNNKSNLWCISNLIIFAVLIIIPYNQIFVCDFIGIKESEIKKDQIYENYYFTFYNDYEKINPMTKKEAIKKFLDKLLKNGLISKDEYNKIFQNIDKVNLVETYYKAREKFSDSLLLKVFMHIPETDNKTRKKEQKSFLDKLKEHSKSQKVNFINMILSNINQNNEEKINNNNIEQDNNLDESNKNIISGAKSSIREYNTNPLLNFANSINGNINSLNSNRIGNNININININFSNDEQKNKNNNKRRRSSLSHKSMEIFKYLVKSEQKKILDYYKNPVLFMVKKMCEGIVFNDNNEENNNINLLSNIKEDDEGNDEHIDINKNIEQKNEGKKKKIKIKVKKKIKIKKKIKKKKQKQIIDNDLVEDNFESSYNM